MKVGKEERKRRKKKEGRETASDIEAHGWRHNTPCELNTSLLGLRRDSRLVRASLAVSAWGLPLVLSMHPVHGSAFYSASPVVIAVE